MTPLIVIGGGGHAREIIDVVDAINRADEVFEFIGFAADEYYNEPEMSSRGAKYLGGVDATLRDIDAEYVIGIGSGEARREIDRIATAHGREAAVLVHPQSSMGFGVELGPGAVVTAGVRLTTEVKLGRHVHLNVNCTVSHDVRLDDYVTLSPGVNVSGWAHVHERVTMGTGSSAIDRVEIGAGTIVGAGATVVKSLPAGVTAVGTPARFNPAS
jgi:sugar O-acyltransferase (sialic acid O-acetyltransferase NeuD family)